MFRIRACVSEDVDELFPIKDLVPLEPPSVADAEAQELSLMGAALSMVRNVAYRASCMEA